MAYHIYSISYPYRTGIESIEYKTQMDKADEIFGLHKIPDNILVKKLLVERGKNLAYIEELEEELGKKGGCAKCRAKNEHIKALENKVRKLSAKQECNEETFERRYYALLKKCQALEKQLLDIAKTSYAKSKAAGKDNMTG